MSDISEMKECCKSEAIEALNWFFDEVTSQIDRLPFEALVGDAQNILDAEIVRFTSLFNGESNLQLQSKCLHRRTSGEIRWDFKAGTECLTCGAISSKPETQGNAEHE